MNQELQTIAAALQANGGKFIDDHNGQLRSFGRDGLALHARHSKSKAPQVSVVMLCHGSRTPYYTINPLTLEADGQVHLNRWSVGGVVTEASDKSFEEHVAQYNRNHGEENTFFHAQLSCITRLETATA